VRRSVTDAAPPLPGGITTRFPDPHGTSTSRGHTGEHPSRHESGQQPGRCLSGCRRLQRIPDPTRLIGTSPRLVGPELLPYAEPLPPARGRRHHLHIGWDARPHGHVRPSLPPALRDEGACVRWTVSRGASPRRPTSCRSRPLRGDESCLGRSVRGPRGLAVEQLRRAARPPAAGSVPGCFASMAPAGSNRGGGANLPRGAG
jgi:hypothetical protein